MQITSTALNEAFKRIAEFEPYDRDSDGRGSWLVGEMSAPYLFFFHHYQKLHDLMQQKSSYRPILDPLIQFLDQSYAEEYRSANELFQRGLVTAYHSAKLYKPSELLVVRDKYTQTLRARVLGRVPDAVPFENKSIWKLECWSWSYNGREARRDSWAEYTDAFPTEEVPINGLQVYPLKYAKPKDIEKLRETGRRFWSMRHQGLRCYTGWDEKRDRHYSIDRFMVDVATFNIMYSSRSRADKVDDTYDKWPQRIEASKEMPPDCELLLPNVIEAFHLDSKKWSKSLAIYDTNSIYKVLNVDGFLPQVDWNKNAFRQLVLDEKIKEMIHALVDVQTSRDKAMDDIIKGKGNGLIILLHGSPGTGKTLTAESVAEIAEKPLYRVTCGDIGINAQEVEKYLQTVMYLGKIWDCVLLLDEADVFLEERTMADLERNSLVSVFLRILEYHEGILILTSNRVGTFDEAFKSRIQVAIHYDNLTKKSRKAIWRNFFDMLEESGEDANMPELERRLNELAEEEMNGRQIRNALLTARQLAQHRHERLDWEHLNQVMKTSAAFNKYLKTVKGHTDDIWAREERIR
ncbi:P-loop containing nucleoside triphosphate hydrolase protein [Apiospora kogelbergensis]|uniref:P-loop containing nucleoside triphosphate hydrolase protein n=1 Tax=Apiospora kogelbergensis TaxID=1337665 RepID=UPI0031312CBE